MDFMNRRERWPWRYILDDFGLFGLLMACIGTTFVYAGFDVQGPWGSSESPVFRAMAEYFWYFGLASVTLIALPVILITHRIYSNRPRGNRKLDDHKFICIDGLGEVRLDYQDSEHQAAKDFAEETEHTAFEAWWSTVGQTNGKEVAWDAWKARAAQLKRKAG